MSWPKTRAPGWRVNTTNPDAVPFCRYHPFTLLKAWVTADRIAWGRPTRPSHAVVA
jgi:hypothetical protein